MIGEALRLLRVYHDLSQTDLALELGLSKSYLSEIESCKKQPTLDLLEKYGQYFEIPVSSLMFFSEKIREGSGLDALRGGVARKVVALLNWVAEKNEQTKSRKKKAA